MFADNGVELPVRTVMDNTAFTNCSAASTIYKAYAKATSRGQHARSLRLTGRSLVGSRGGHGARGPR